VDVRIPYGAYLASLIAEASTAAGRLLDLDEDTRARLAASAARSSARLSARLDGSPLEDATADAVDAGRWQRPAEVMAGQQSRGWAAALRIDGMATQDVAAVEYDNLVRAHAREHEWADRLFDEPLQVLSEVHAAVSAGLVDPDVAGRPRRTEQAVHDGAQGRVIFNTPAPDALPRLLDGLQRWLRGTDSEASTAHPAPVVAAVVHEHLLQWQPYESSNGRVARAAARLVLRAKGMDPAGLAVPEHRWAAEPGAYYGEVAATLRRRGDLGPWTERHTEALVEALHRVATAAGLTPAADEPGDRARRAVATMASGETITVADHAARWGISREAAWSDLRSLAVYGHLEREPKTLGRRFRRP